MKQILIFLYLILVSGCTSIADLQKPAREQFFILPADYVRTQVRGWDKFRWIEGLKAGKYISIGEDSEGVYFIGSGRSVIKLANELADDYLKTRKIPAQALINKGVLDSAVHVGGLYVPKKGTNAEAKLFYEVRNTTDGSQLGITGYTIVMLTEGALNYIPYQSEKEFIKNINIIDR